MKLHDNRIVSYPMLNIIAKVIPFSYEKTRMLNSTAKYNFAWNSQRRINGLQRNKRIF